eukprot:scaffold196_cov225-Chaetoceros_neogracile.AAC.5
MDEDTMIVCCEDTEDNDRFPPGKEYVRASSSAFWKYERLPETSGIPQTRVTYIQQADMKGYIPSFIANKKIVGALSHLSKMRNKFDTSFKIDSGRRETIVQAIKLKSKSVAAGGAKALAEFESFCEKKKKWERPSNSFGTADSKVKVEVFGGQAWGMTKLDIRASMEEVAAFLWDFGSRSNMEISGDVERNIEEEGEEIGKKVVRRRQQLHSKRGIRHRDCVFSSELTLQKADEDTIILNFIPIGVAACRSRFTRQYKTTFVTTDRRGGKELLTEIDNPKGT